MEVIWVRQHHESRAGHVRREFELLDDDVQRGDEEVLADQRQRVAHVERQREVQQEARELRRVLPDLEGAQPEVIRAI